MTLSQLIIGWFYYGIFLMGLSVVATILLNRVVKHYVTAPLLINAFSVVLLMGMLWLRMMTNEQFWYNLLFLYMPVVFASAMCNLVLFIVRKGRPLRDDLE